MKAPQSPIFIVAAAAATLWCCSTRIKDRIPQVATEENRPFAVEISPGSGVAGVAPVEPIRVTLSEPLSPLTVNDSTFQLISISPAMPVTGVLSLNPLWTEVTFTPDQPLSPGMDYEILLTASIQDQEGSSLISSSAVPVPSQFTTIAAVDGTAPVFGGAGSAMALSEETIAVTWSPGIDGQTASNEIVYFIYAATASGGQDFGTPAAVARPGDTRHLVTGLQPGTTYFFVVRSRDNHGNFEFNTVETSATTDPAPDGVFPAFAAAVGASPQGPTSISLFWADGTDNRDPPSDLRYRIYLRPAGGTRNLSNPHAETAPGETTYLVTGLAPGEHFFIVRAVDTSGNEETNLVEVSSSTVMSYGRSIQPIFDMNCTRATCHVGVVPAAGILLTNYTGAISRVVPGDPASSLIIRRIDERIQAPDPPFIPPRMPSGGLALPDRDIANIREWVQQGALNN